VVSVVLLVALDVVPTIVAVSLVVL
jgi:hypothetical protein